MQHKKQQLWPPDRSPMEKIEWIKWDECWCGSRLPGVCKFCDDFVDDFEHIENILNGFLYVSLFYNGVDHVASYVRLCFKLIGHWSFCFQQTNIFMLFAFDSWGLTNILSEHYLLCICIILRRLHSHCPRQTPTKCVARIQHKQCQKKYGNIFAKEFSIVTISIQIPNSHLYLWSMKLNLSLGKRMLLCQSDALTQPENIWICLFFWNALLRPAANLISNSDLFRFVEILLSFQSENFSFCWFFWICFAQ